MMASMRRARVRAGTSSSGREPVRRSEPPLSASPAPLTLLPPQKERSAYMPLLVPTSPGEFLDKVSILEIKAERIRDADGLPLSLSFQWLSTICAARPSTLARAFSRAAGAPARPNALATSTPSRTAGQVASIGLRQPRKAAAAA